MEESIADMRKIWCPIKKSISDTEEFTFNGILSDTSIDRDGEKISSGLLSKWARESKELPVLADHKNETESFVGKLLAKNIIRKGDDSALEVSAKLFKSNPKAQLIMRMMEEGADFGLSIGAIPRDFEEIETKGITVKEWKDAELLEGSIVVIPSNRNSLINNRSSYAVLAKKFGLITKPQQVEDCVKALMEDPDFKPQEGRSKEESAWAVCQSRFGKNCTMEDNKMGKIKKQDSSEEFKEEVQEAVEEEVMPVEQRLDALEGAVAELQSEVFEEDEEQKEEENEEVEEKAMDEEEEDEVDEKKSISILQKQKALLEREIEAHKGVLKALSDNASVVEKQVEKLDLKKALSMLYGGN